MWTNADITYEGKPLKLKYKLLHTDQAERHHIPANVELLAAIKSQCI